MEQVLGQHVLVHRPRGLKRRQMFVRVDDLQAEDMLTQSLIGVAHGYVVVKAAGFVNRIMRSHCAGFGEMAPHPLFCSPCSHSSKFRDRPYHSRHFASERPRSERAWNRRPPTGFTKCFARPAATALIRPIATASGFRPAREPASGNLASAFAVMATAAKLFSSPRGATRPCHRTILGPTAICRRRFWRGISPKACGDWTSIALTFISCTATTAAFPSARLSMHCTSTSPRAGWGPSGHQTGRSSASPRPTIGRGNRARGIRRLSGAIQFGLPQHRASAQ